MVSLEEKLKDFSVDDLIEMCCSKYALFVSNRLSEKAKERSWKEFLVCKEEIKRRMK